jgi:hypothetical protein
MIVTTKVIAGAVMLATPLAALFALIWYRDGLRVALGVFAVTAAVGGWLYAAGVLLES